LPQDSVEVDFGAGPMMFNRSTVVLNLRPENDVQPPASTSVDWSQLDAFPRLRTVEWSGPARGIDEAVAARPHIQFLYWYNAEGDIDLRSTYLNTVRLEGAGLRRVLLPASIRTLLLRRPPAELEVDAPDLGHRLDLRLFQYGPDVVIPRGLRRTTQLWLWVGGEVSATVLSGLTDLAELRLTFGDPRGILTDLPELGRHHRLHSLQLDDAYGLVADEFPELTSLRSLELSGIRRTTATALKARFNGTPVAVSVRGAKSDGWLSAHMDNPFRDWVDESKPFGQAACSAYNRTRRAAEAITPEDPGRLAKAELVLREFVTEFNTINDKYGLIDTINRDHVGDVFFDLVTRLQVPLEQANAWFDDGRRF
jgi:hypothetical protein